MKKTKKCVLVKHGRGRDQKSPLRCKGWRKAGKREVPPTGLNSHVKLLSKSKSMTRKKTSPKARIETKQEIKD